MTWSMHIQNAQEAREIETQCKRKVRETEFKFKSTKEKHVKKNFSAKGSAKKKHEKRLKLKFSAKKAREQTPNEAMTAHERK